MNSFYGDSRLNSRAFFDSIDPDREQYNIAIKYAKEHGASIYKIKELKELYTQVNKRIMELATKQEIYGEDEESTKELEYLNKVFYGLVGLMIDNKNKSMNQA